MVAELLSLLVHEDAQEDFRSIAPDLADDVELWAYRYSTVLRPLHDLFGQGRDWLRVSVEYLHSLRGGVIPYHANLTTYLRNGDDFVIETTPGGLAKYTQILVDELIDIPKEAEAELDEDEVHELLESARKLQARFTGGQEQVSR
jgi:hypothetical protein